MSLSQMECGTTTPFLDLDPAIWFPLVTQTWITCLWRDCKTANIAIKIHPDHFWTPAPPRQNDITIMSVAHTMYSGLQLFQINQCRIFLQVTFLSDIASVDGTRILLSYYNGKGHSDTGRVTRLTWPPIGDLPQQYWALWQEFLERWCGSSLRLPVRLGGWFDGAEVLTRICFFMLDRRLILQQNDAYLEFSPYTPRSRTCFTLATQPFHDALDLTRLRAADITFKGNSIFVIASHSVTNIIHSDQNSAPTTIFDLYAQLPPSLQRLIGKIDWPPHATLERITSSISDGTLVGASDGSVRYEEALSTHAWILQAPDGSEIADNGPVDGATCYRTSHRAEIQGQTALLLIISLFAKYFKLCHGKLTTFCDNQPVVKKLQKGWQLFRLRHTKGSDSDMQAILRSTLDTLRIEHGITHSTEWVCSHQDKQNDIRSLPKEVALNIRMDEATKTAYTLPQSWLTQESVPVYNMEGCAVYIDGIKVVSSLHSTLAEHWHMEDARAYIFNRHGFTETLLRNIHWPA